MSFDKSMSRFGSNADMCGATSHVRFARNSDRGKRLSPARHVRFTSESHKSLFLYRESYFDSSSEVLQRFLLRVRSACVASSQH
jgi:hypothetical protein